MATTYLGQIEDCRILVIPCRNVKKFIESIITEDISDEMPLGIQGLILSNPVQPKSLDYCKSEYLVTTDDQKFIKSLNMQHQCKSVQHPLVKPSYSMTNCDNRDCLIIQDLHWLYKYIQKQNKDSNKKIYLHELLEGSEIILPKNQVITRNKDLDRRCRTLEIKQQNKEYWTMTKNVDNLQKNKQDDTICYEIKVMNRHLIAIFQYIISIITGFVFGFYGIEMMTTPLDLGFRLLLGVMCGLAVALSELYFLAKALNTDLNDDLRLCKQKTFKFS